MRFDDEQRVRLLRELGVTDAQGRLVPAMSRKWKQINKFVEVLDLAFDGSPLTLTIDHAPDAAGVTLVTYDAAGTVVSVSILRICQGSFCHDVLMRSQTCCWRSWSGLTVKASNSAKVISLRA